MFHFSCTVQSSSPGGIFERRICWIVCSQVLRKPQGTEKGTLCKQDVQLQQAEAFFFKPHISQYFPNISKYFFQYFPIFFQYFPYISQYVPNIPSISQYIQISPLKQPARMVPSCLPTRGAQLQWEVPEKINNSDFLFQIFQDFFFFPNFCRCKLNFFFPDVDSKRVDELVKKIRFNNNEPTETDQAILLQKTSSAGLRGVLCQNVPSEEDVTSKAAAGKFQQENSNNWKNSIILWSYDIGSSTTNPSCQCKIGKKTVD